MDSQLFMGDCLEQMSELSDNSIDCVLVDPPYGTTQCKWDSVIPLRPMWILIKRIVKSTGAVCIFGCEPFSSALRMSNIKNFRYDWIWHKTDMATNHLNAKRQPMRRNEIISVFFYKQSTYNPQLVKRETPTTNRTNRNQANHYGKMIGDTKRGIPLDMAYPHETLLFRRHELGDGIHPTQKPVALLEYLIHTYTEEEETVLDFAMGSGSTGIACYNTNRKFIGIEKDPVYFEIAQTRINHHF